MSESGDSYETFTNSQSLGLRIQKKIASKMSNKNVAKMFIDDTTGRILDDMHHVVKEYSGNRKLADKLLNDTIKIIVKIGLLVRNNQLTDAEIKICSDFRETFHYFVKSALSFYEVHYTYDNTHLIEILHSCEKSMQIIVKNHLTDKSKQRIEHVFAYFANSKFLEEIFKNDKYGAKMNSIVSDVRQLIDEGSI